MDDPSVDSTLIGVCSLVIPFPLPEAAILWIFLGVILHKSNTKHSVHNPDYVTTRVVFSIHPNKLYNAALLINVHACG